MGNMRKQKTTLWVIGIGSMFFLVLVLMPYYLHQHYRLSDAASPSSVSKLELPILGEMKKELGNSLSNSAPESTGEKDGKDHHCAADWLFESKSLRQDDPRVLNYIRKYHLTLPSSKPYALGNPNGDPSAYSQQISKIFKLDQPQTSKGFFIEAGALDGESGSNTLLLEKKFGWNGILIEPNPLNLVQLRQKNRKAWIMDICISFTGSPLKILFNHRLTENGGNPGMGMLEHSANNPYPRNSKYNYDAILQPKDFVSTGFAECFPLFSIMSALNVTVVDYFSLDIQGPELKVLKSIPFDLITIKAMSVEYSLNTNGEEVISKFLKSKGYRVFTVAEEVFAVHKDYDYSN